MSIKTYDLATIEHIVKTSSEQILDMQVVSKTARFVDIGLDSINFVRLIVELEEIFEFEFPEEALISNIDWNVKILSEYIFKFLNLQ